MANKGLNEVRVWGGNVPNIGSSISSCCNKLAIRRETPVSSFTTGHMEFSHSCSGIRFLNCDNFLITQSKLSLVWEESNMGTIICRGDLVTIDIPLPDLITAYGQEVLWIHGPETNILHCMLLLYDTMTFPCLNVPQMKCVII